MQGLRTKNHIHIWRTLLDIITFLRGNTTTNTNDKIWVFSFNLRQRPNSEKTFSCAFSRIEQVFIINTSASLISLVMTIPWLLPKTSPIFWLSYSFI
ncbi:hypothetical protein E9Q_04704 [Moraxella catarrhalis BC1]|nr:hypothetical protein E9Q_04704 [Moraxella catarrhalis BC1]